MSTERGSRAKLNSRYEEMPFTRKWFASSVFGKRSTFSVKSPAATRDPRSKRNRSALTLRMLAIYSAVIGPSFIGVTTSSCMPESIMMAVLAANLRLFIVSGRIVELAIVKTFRI